MPMMSPQRRKASSGRLIALIVVLLMCIWMLYRIFIDVPPAPPAEVEVGVCSQNITHVVARGFPRTFFRAN